MRKEVLPNGVIAQVNNDETITTKAPTAKGGLKKTISDNQQKIYQIDKAGLKIAMDFLNQAANSIAQAQKILSGVLK